MKKTIGTRHETSLHRDLKFSYAGKGGRIEAEVAGFVADGINAQGEFIEVQTGSFAPLKHKAKELAQRGKVRVVYPVIITKYIDVYDANAKRKYRRKSPRTGTPWDIFNALVHAPDLPLIAGLAVELVLIDALELRVQDGKGSWRRKGVSIKDRRILAFHERILLKKPSDYARFIPFRSSEQFTSRSLGEKAGIRIDIARKVLYVLIRLGIIEKTGKQRNLTVYRRLNTPRRAQNSKTTK